MIKTITLKEILSSNPQIDKELLKKARNLRRELHQVGVNGHSYNLASPFHRRYKSVSKKNVQL
jgi:hypothetical protein